MAEHWPMQLVPLPQVTLVRVVSLPQQPTSIDSLEKVKEDSKKSMSVGVVLPWKINIIQNDCCPENDLFRLTLHWSLLGLLKEIPSFIEEHFSTPTSILRLRIDPVSGFDEGLAAKTFTS